MRDSRSSWLFESRTCAGRDGAKRSHAAPGCVCVRPREDGGHLTGAIGLRKETGRSALRLRLKGDLGLGPCPRLLLSTTGCFTERRCQPCPSPNSPQQRPAPLLKKLTLPLSSKTHNGTSLPGVGFASVNPAWSAGRRARAEACASACCSRRSLSARKACNTCSRSGVERSDAEPVSVATLAGVRDRDGGEGFALEAPSGFCRGETQGSPPTAEAMRWCRRGPGAGVLSWCGGKTWAGRRADPSSGTGFGDPAVAPGDAFLAAPVSLNGFTSGWTAAASSTGPLPLRPANEFNSGPVAACPVPCKSLCSSPASCCSSGMVSLGGCRNDAGA